MAVAAAAPPDGWKPSMWMEHFELNLWHFVRKEQVVESGLEWHGQNDKAPVVALTKGVPDQETNAVAGDNGLKTEKP